MSIPATSNGEKPFIMGGLLPGKYAAEDVHLHWGSPNSRGAEHVLNNIRYDVEMHIVHRNLRYATLEEALRYSDGVAVLGVMMKIVRTQDRIYPGLQKFFAEIPKVTRYHTETRLPGSLALGQLLGDLNTRDFYTFKGSLTTPGCNEAVTWTVFSRPMSIPLSYVSRLWRLQDAKGNLIRNNFRVLQARNNRPVFYRRTRDL
ncbi:hypothetical protein KR222_008755, partial [Zaprionus bogoriensis]